MSKRFTVFDLKVAEQKGYTYSSEQIDYIIEQLNDKEKQLFYMEEPKLKPSLERVAGRLVNPEFNGEVITAEVETLNTVMGILANSLIEAFDGATDYPFEISIVGTGLINNKYNRVEDYEYHSAFLYNVPFREWVSR